MKKQSTECTYLNVIYFLFINIVVFSIRNIYRNIIICYFDNQEDECQGVLYLKKQAAINNRRSKLYNSMVYSLKLEIQFAVEVEI